jgi:hypothetical protein
MMTSGSSVFGRNVYRLSDLEVGDTKAFPYADEAEVKRIRKAAHNLNVRSDNYFITRCKDGVIYITRIR